MFGSLPELYTDRATHDSPHKAKSSNVWHKDLIHKRLKYLTELLELLLCTALPQDILVGPVQRQYLKA
jgi:hypothetical protein